MSQLTLRERKKHDTPSPFFREGSVPSRGQYFIKNDAKKSRRPKEITYQPFGLAM
jgi:hypothetical protein